MRDITREERQCWKKERPVDCVRERLRSLKVIAKGSDDGGVQGGENVSGERKGRNRNLEKDNRRKRRGKGRWDGWITIT